MARLVEMYADGCLEKQALQNDMDISRRRLSGLEAEQAELRSEEERREALRLVIGRLEEFAEQLRGGLDTSDATTRRRIICALVKQVEIDLEEAHIVYRVNPRRPRSTSHGKPLFRPAEGRTEPDRIGRER
jgi:hypothetical protein